MIRNLMFDLGGVIMDIRRQNCEEAFRKLGLDDPSKFFGDYGQSGPFRGIEEGTITVHQFHEEVKTILPRPVSDHEIDEAFMKFLIGIPLHRLHELQELRHRYKLYLLSNTNEIMWHAKIADEFKQDGLTMEDYFDGIVTSFEAKSLKPAAKIFKFAEEKFHISSSETLFLDDSSANIAAAEALGFKGAVVPDGTEFIDILRKLDLA